MTSRSQIIGNRVTNGTQINLSLSIDQLIYSHSPRDGSEDTIGAVREFLLSMVLSPSANKGHSPIVNQAPSSTIIHEPPPNVDEALQQKEYQDDPAISALQEYFPEVSRFKDDLNKCLFKYNCDSYAIATLKDEQIECIKKWVDTNNGGILLIQWDETTDYDMHYDPRTTDLALEFIGIYNHAKNDPVLFHFCGQPAVETEGRYELVIQDLITQLFKKSADKSGDFYENLTSAMSQTSDNIEHLWDLFKKLILIMKPSSITIILDKVHSMYPLGTTGNVATHDFYERLQSLLKSLEETGIIAKVVMTSASPEAIFSMEDLAGSHIEINPDEWYDDNHELI